MMIRQKAIDFFAQVKAAYEDFRETRGLNQAGALIGLLGLLAIFWIFAPAFRQIENMVLLARTASIAMGIVAIGQTVVLISGGIDLSVGSIVAFTSIISAHLMSHGFGPIPPLTGAQSYLAILIGWLSGVLIGAAQGWLITRTEIPSFIATLGTMVSLRGISVGMSGGYTISGLPGEFQWMSNSSLGIVPVSLLIMLGIYTFTAYCLSKTKPGRYCYAIGGNQTAARLSGVKINRYKVIYYAYSGLLAAVAGTLLSAYIDGATYTNGEGYEMSSIASAIMGGTSLSGGVGSIWGTLVGVMILTVVPNGMVMLDAPYWGRDVVTGVVILIAVLVDMNRQKARKAARPRLDINQSTFSGSYLNRILGQLSLLIIQRTGCTVHRLFLTDRDTGDLVQQNMHMKSPDGTDLPLKGGMGGIVSEAQTGLRIVRVDDLKRAVDSRVTPLQDDISSAIAFPLLLNGRLVGVLELQSPFVAVFDDHFVAMIQEIIDSVLVKLEDAWLFESGWLTRMTRDALRHLWDDLYLGRCSLFNWTFSHSNASADMSPGERGEVLRDLLLEAINNLDPHHDTASGRSDDRKHRILALTYVEELAIQQILRHLHISRRQYFYELKDAIEILTDCLMRNRIVDELYEPV
jgi:ribose/xylose/arabinose/galactoside ABC-type transport system permease subunit